MLVLTITLEVTDRFTATWRAIRDATSSKDKLAVLGRGLGFDTCIQNNVTNVQKISPYMMATAVEAIVGAMYLDCGKDLKVVRGLLDAMGIMLAEVGSEHCSI